MADSSISLQLPYPPSINHYYIRKRNGVCIGPKGKAYRELVTLIITRQHVDTLKGPLRMDIAIYPPDKRRRDIDNVQKALLDAIEHGGAYENDCQITKLTIEKKEPLPGGLVECEIWKR